MAGKTARININVTPQQKSKLMQRAKKENITLTNFILNKCLKDDPAESQQMNILEVENRFLLEKVDMLQKEYDDLKQMYQITHQAMLWHSLPFYKKIGKRLELPNKEQ